LGGTQACAHRGDQKAAPENTIPAFESAVRKKAAQIELDVHLSKDGELVIIHDATLNRTTDGTGPVADRTLAELRALDAGSWFSPAFAGTKIPTLREALDVIPHDILVNVHLKNAPGVAAGSAKLIAAMERLDHCFLACTIEQAAEAKQVAPTIKICNMTRQTLPGAYVKLTLQQKSDFIQLHVGGWLGKLSDVVATCHAAGITVNYFGAQEEKLIRSLADAGVDYILTDDLDLCQRVLAEHAKQAPANVDRSARN
jgi:glycerophosphoryl diester phosphodiesterase